MPAYQTKNPLRIPSSSMALLAMLALSSCESGTGNGDGKDPQGSPPVSLHVRHVHFPTTFYNGVVKNDLPRPVRIELNGIPGQFDGFPTEDILFDTVLADDSPFPLRWEQLLQAPLTQPQPFVGGGMIVDSVTPASTRIMRMGTFADDGTGENVFPDSLFEAYGIYDTVLKVGVTAVYFSGPATLYADKMLCDSTHLKFQVRIPGAGFWFLYTQYSGKNMSMSLLGNPDNLVFSVNTISEAGFDFIESETERLWGCLMPVEKVGVGTGLPDWLGWMK